MLTATYYMLRDGVEYRRLQRRGTSCSSAPG